MKKKIIGILLAVTLTVSQAGIVVYAEDVTCEDEFTQMDEADESETPRNHFINHVCQNPRNRQIHHRSRQFNEKPDQHPQI